ncbi:S49 family peptidase [Planctomyces sp. SH-PL14]|uniref:S49 family peptidase n=1 Tax=Planctomyces sp. SH-PL14 TaxID=1632864 RepID=UPI0009462A9E|nr:S49 family peptidase [Planctomyces sp. SH-PL14]
MESLRIGPIHGFGDFDDDDDGPPQTSTLGSVGVINVYGLLQRRADSLMHLTGGTAVEFVGQVFATMLKNPRLSSIVLRFDSMGGDFQGVPELAKRIYAARGTKPIYAHADGWMAGASYWLATAAGQLVATQSSPGIGGLGFVRLHFDQSKYMENLGVRTTIISSSPYKAEENPYEPLSSETKAHIESRVAIWDAEMSSDIATYRNRPVTDVMRNFGQGRVLLSEDAKEAGLVDSVESFDALIDRLGGTRR